MYSKVVRKEDRDTDGLFVLIQKKGQILISTSESDWIKEVTDDVESLAGLIKLEYVNSTVKVAELPIGGIKGLYPTSVTSPTTGLSLSELSLDSTPTATPPKLSILNASFNSTSSHSHHQSVIVLPDFKIVMEVPETKQGAKELVSNYLDGNVRRAGNIDEKREGSLLKSW